tara:strand:+ start:1321 stop:1716 length:396 start_codon:yes stop_codon:yes gene_type:complete
MKIKYIKNIYLSFFAVLILFTPLKAIEASTPEWIGVPKSFYGEQLWDKNSVKKNQEGSIRVFSKFIPKSTTEISQEILYTMDIKCEENTFRDIAVGSKEFNEFKNKDAEWKSPNGDELILGIIDQVCAFSK